MIGITIIGNVFWSRILLKRSFYKLDFLSISISTFIVSTSVAFLRTYLSKSQSNNTEKAYFITGVLLDS